MGIVNLLSSSLSSWSGILLPDSLHGMNALLDLFDVRHHLLLCIVSSMLKTSLDLMLSLGPGSNNFVDSVVVDRDGHFLG